MMAFSALFAILVVINLSTLNGFEISRQNSDSTCSEHLNLTVFFEAGCIDSNRFFSDVLTPQYEAFGNTLTLDLVPWGNAKSFNSSYGTGFVSQHGLQEVRSNTYMACASEMIEHELYVKLVTCMMSTKGSIQATYDSWSFCSKGNVLDEGRVYDCYKGQGGINAMLDMESKAKDNGHTFIPWLVLNGKSGDTLQATYDNAKGFVDLLCGELCDNMRPKICSYY